MKIYRSKAVIRQEGEPDVELMVYGFSPIDHKKVVLADITKTAEIFGSSLGDERYGFEIQDYREIELAGANTPTTEGASEQHPLGYSYVKFARDVEPNVLSAAELYERGLPKIYE